MKRWLLSVTLCSGLFLSPLAQAAQLVDAPAHPVLAGRVNLALESFKVMQAYPDRTFQGQRAFTRYELADAMQRALFYLKNQHKLDLNTDPRTVAMFQVYFRPSGDIPERHWAAGAVQQTLALGLVKGEMDLQFHGAKKVTRYQLAQSIHSLLDWLQIKALPMSNQLPQDLPPQHWATEAVRHMVAAGILELDRHGRFQGDQPATRYELAEALVKALQQIDIVARREALRPKTVVALPVPVLKPRYDGRRPPFGYLGTF